MGYGSLDEVYPFARHVLNGELSFNSTTRPTQTEVQKFMDRASAKLNLVLAGEGFTVPFTSTSATSTAVLVCDDWVIKQTVAMVELTQPGNIYDDEVGGRVSSFVDLSGEAKKFVEENKLGLIRLGAPQSHRDWEGAIYTGMDKASQRSDPSNTSREQPKFNRAQWDVD